VWESVPRNPDPVKRRLLNLASALSVLLCARRWACCGWRVSPPPVRLFEGLFNE